MKMSNRVSFSSSGRGMNLFLIRNLMQNLYQKITRVNILITAAYTRSFTEL